MAKTVKITPDDVLNLYKEPADEQVKVPTLIEKAIESGIKLKKVQFHAAVNNADNIPEFFFSSESLVKSRNVDMWLTTIGYVFGQKNAQGDYIYFGTPTANGIFHYFK